MYSMRRIYRGSLSAAPSLYDYLEETINTTPYNTKLSQLFKELIKDTKQNRDILFWGDPIAPSFSYITIYTITGENVKFKTGNNQANELIEEWKGNINNLGQNYIDLFADSYVDNCTHGNSYWRNLETDDSPVGLDTSRLDVTSLTDTQEYINGWRAIIQRALKHQKRFYSKAAFYNYVKKETAIWYEQTKRPSETKYDYIVVPMEDEYLLSLDFFRHPPISTVLSDLYYKKWIKVFMKNYSERYWAPPRVGYVGDGDYIPDDETQFAQERNSLFNAMLRLKNHGVMATAGYNRIEELSSNTAASSSIYVDYLNMLNEEIMFALMGSMGQRTARGNELATSRVLEQGFLRYCQGIRARYRLALKEYFIKVLFPINNITGITRNRIEVDYPPMQIEKTKDLVESLLIAAEANFFTDWTEPRAILSTIWDSLVDVDEAIGKKLKKEYQESRQKNEGIGSNSAGKHSSGTVLANSKQKPKTT